MPSPGREQGQGNSSHLVDLGLIIETFPLLGQVLLQSLPTKYHHCHELVVDSCLSFFTFPSGSFQCGWHISVSPLYVVCVYGRKGGEIIYIFIYSSPDHKESHLNLKGKLYIRTKFWSMSCMQVSGWHVLLTTLGRLVGVFHGVGKRLQMSIWCQE